ncbi:MAG: hypothetical protein R3C19_20085 [Planctomycetaceae bacterium]
MRPICCNLSWFAAAVCVLAGSGFAVAQQGVVRISDTGRNVPAASAASRQAPGVHRTGYVVRAQSEGAGAYVPPADFNENMAPPPVPTPDPSSYAPQNFDSGACGLGYCGEGAACGEGCYDGCGCGEGCDQGQCCGCDICLCDPCFCNGGNGCQCGYGNGFNQRMCTLFARPAKSCSGNIACKAWRGQQYNYLNRNQRLSNCLFGWMVPSGNCGQGTPPVGKYRITYANQPDYADARDGQLYGVQGYGMPMTVPIAPTVRYAYNYSWGTPASRLTPLSTYNPQTSPQHLLHRTW